MREMRNEERIKTAKGKYKRLLDMVFDALDGADVNPNRIRLLIHDIYKDELELISIADELETERRNRENKEIEIPDFMVKGKRA